MVENLESELNQIDRFIEQIGEIADKDGTITKEEQAILDTIFNDLSNYRVLVLDALDDGVITPQEEEQMKNSRERILENANAMAMADGQFSDDEEQLLDSLLEFVRR